MDLDGDWASPPGSTAAPFQRDILEDVPSGAAGDEWYSRADCRKPVADSRSSDGPSPDTGWRHQFAGFALGSRGSSTLRGPRPRFGKNPLLVEEFFHNWLDRRHAGARAAMVPLPRSPRGPSGFRTRKRFWAGAKTNRLQARRTVRGRGERKGRRWTGFRSSDQPGLDRDYRRAVGRD